MQCGCRQNRFMLQSGLAIAVECFAAAAQLAFMLQSGRRSAAGAGRSLLCGCREMYLSGVEPDVAPGLRNNTLCDGIVSLAAATEHTTALAKSVGELNKIQHAQEKATWLPTTSVERHYKCPTRTCPAQLAPRRVFAHALHWPRSRCTAPRRGKLTSRTIAQSGEKFAQRKLQCRSTSSTKRCISKGWGNRWLNDVSV